MVDKVCTTSPNGTETCTLTYDRGWVPNPPVYVGPDGTPGAAPAAKGVSNSSILFGLLAILLVFGLLALLFRDRPVAPRPQWDAPREIPMRDTGVPIS